MERIKRAADKSRSFGVIFQCKIVRASLDT